MALCSPFGGEVMCIPPNKTIPMQANTWNTTIKVEKSENTDGSACTILFDSSWKDGTKRMR